MTCANDARHCDDQSRAYHVAGDVVLNQSDLLIVVWDGERRNKRGGTEQTFDDALERGVPIVWIDAHAPQRSKSMSIRLKLLVDALEELRSRIDVDLPSQPLSPEITHAASNTARAMANEVLDWRVIFQDRPLRTT